MCLFAWAFALLSLVLLTSFLVLLRASLNLSGEIQRLEARLDSSTEKSEALDIPPWVNRPRSNLLTGLIRGGREGYEDTEGDDR